MSLLVYLLCQARIGYCGTQSDLQGEATSQGNTREKEPIGLEYSAYP